MDKTANYWPFLKWDIIGLCALNLKIIIFKCRNNDDCLFPLSSTVFLVVVVLTVPNMILTIPRHRRDSSMNYKKKTKTKNEHNLPYVLSHIHDQKKVINKFAVNEWASPLTTANIGMSSISCLSEFNLDIVLGGFIPLLLLHASITAIPEPHSILVP